MQQEYIHTWSVYFPYFTNWINFWPDFVSCLYWVSISRKICKEKRWPSTTTFVSICQIVADISKISQLLSNWINFWRIFSPFGQRQTRAAAAIPSLIHGQSYHQICYANANVITYHYGRFWKFLSKKYWRQISILGTNKYINNLKK